jgi:hypothetical protein
VSNAIPAGPGQPGRAHQVTTVAAALAKEQVGSHDGRVGAQRNCTLDAGLGSHNPTMRAKCKDSAKFLSRSSLAHTTAPRRLDSESYKGTIGCRLADEKRD